MFPSKLRYMYFIPFCTPNGFVKKIEGECVSVINHNAPVSFVYLDGALHIKMMIKISHTFPLYPLEREKTRISIASSGVSHYNIG